MNVSINTRLKISSIFMLATVAVVGFMFFLGAQKAYFASKDIAFDKSSLDPVFFVKVVSQFKAEELKRWNMDLDLAQILKEADASNVQYAKAGLQVTIYDGNTPLTAMPFPLDENISALAFRQTGEHFIMMDNLALYINDVHGHKTILSYNKLSPKIYVYDGAREVYVWIALASAMLLALVAINLFLLHFVSRPIRRALNSLSGGVNQIRQGNLDFRLEYKGRDEFTEICGEFNAMASQLQASVQKVEQEIQNKKEMVAGISHDLRTPLTSIKAYVEGLIKGVANTPEKQLKYLTTIRDKSDELEKLIERLFLFSTLTAQAPAFATASFDLGAEVKRIVGQVKDEYAQAGLAIEITGEPPAVTAEMDPMLLNMILINVFENSLKYKEKPHGRLDMVMTIEGENIKIVLADDGPGVPEKDLHDIFEIFYRCDKARSNPGKGSGLGLAIIAKTVTQLGGRVWAENVATGGLAIIMVFPVKTEIENV